jgi:hypothetical protein
MKPGKTPQKRYNILLKTACIIVLLVFANAGFTQGRVLINEYLSWPANSCAATSEYIELYNFGPGPANIGCYLLTDGDYSITIPPNTIIQPGQYFVIAGQNSLPIGCANANAAVTVNLNWNTCNCTSGPIPTTGDGFMTDGGSGSEQLVLFDASFKVADAIVRDLSETSSPINSSSVSGQCAPHMFDLDTMNIRYEMVGESQGRANSFARRTDGGCGWLKDPQQSGGATNNTPGATSDFAAFLTVTSAYTCTNTGAATVSVSSGDYSQIFPMRYTLARDIDSNNVFDFSDNYLHGIDSSSHTVAVNNLIPGIYKMVIETNSGCDLTGFNFNILDCYSGVLDIKFSSFELVTLPNKLRLVWDVGQREKVKYFIVQKSTDGINYTNYDTISNISDPVFISSFFFEDDLSANKEFYRILSETKDGRTSLSPVKNIEGTDTVTQISVYPNPFIGNLTFSVQGNRPESIDIFICDIFGKMIRSEQQNIQPGNNKISIKTSSLQPGVYIIKWGTISSRQRGITRIIKFSQ